MRKGILIGFAATVLMGAGYAGLRLHAASHASTGNDPITIAESQVTNLATDLAAKAPLASPVFTGSATAPAFSSTAASGSNAFGVTTNGARVDFGAGANDYASSDGTTVTFAGPISTTTINASSGTVPMLTVSNFLSWSGAYDLVSFGCDSSREGRMMRAQSTGGTNSGARTKLCVCTSDGAASPSYAWQNLASGAVGTTTTCP
jgi:hypothetical protein